MKFLSLLGWGPLNVKYLWDMLVVIVIRGPFVALAWHVPLQRCFHRLGCKGVGCCLYQACMYDLN